jgi:hypothetical protein
MTLVLDALDEADREKRAELMEVIDALITLAAKPVIGFISSRCNTDIR